MKHLQNKSRKKDAKKSPRKKEKQHIQKILDSIMAPGKIGFNKDTGKNLEKDHYKSQNSIEKSENSPESFQES